MTKQERYREVVREVKEKMRKGGAHTGDQTRFEIAKRWAKERKVSFEEKRPPGPRAAGSMAPTAPGFPEVPAPEPGPAGAMRIKIPREEG